MELSDIIRRAWCDPVFKQHLLDDPRGILEEMLGIVLPAELKVYVHEQTPIEVHLILPPAPGQPCEEQ
jgi:hypothetical protein